MLLACVGLAGQEAELGIGVRLGASRRVVSRHSWMVVLSYGRESVVPAHHPRLNFNRGEAEVSRCSRPSA